MNGLHCIFNIHLKEVIRLKDVSHFPPFLIYQFGPNSSILNVVAHKVTNDFLPFLRSVLHFYLADFIVI
jgi:hypothetical protein